MEATRLLLESEGIEGLTTHKIAVRAGVSIGSLYQYFPNREAVIRVLAMRQWQRAAQRLETACRATEGRPFVEVARACVRVLASTAHGTAPLRRALLLEVPRRWLRPTTAEVHQAIVDQVVELLRAYGADGAVELRAFTLVHAVQGAVDAALIEQPTWFESEAQLEPLVDELTRMVWLHAVGPEAFLEPS